MKGDKGMFKGTYIDFEGYHVKAWPDNDGGLWFWHPVTHEKVVIE